MPRRYVGRRPLIPAGLGLGLLVSGLLAGVAGAVPVPLAFNNTPDVLYQPQVDQIYLYEDVRVGVDALLTVVAVTGNVSTTTVDDKDLDATVFTSGAFINTRLENTGSSRSVTYRLDFQDADTGQPVTVSDIAISVKDLDGNGGVAGEYVEFAGITKYCVLGGGNDDIAIEANVGGVAGKYRFAGEQAQADVDEEEGWVEVFYPAVSSVVVTVGELAGNGARIAQSFDAAGWIPGTDSCTTVTRPSYTLTYDANGATSGTVPSSTSGTGELTVASNTGSLADLPRVFSGWNSKADGTGQSFEAGAKYTPSSDLTLYAQFASQVITFPVITVHPSTGAAPVLGDAPFDPTVSASSGLPVALASTTPAVCTVSGSTVTLVALGDCTLTADQAGNGTYGAAARVTRTFTVREPVPPASPGTTPVLSCAPPLVASAAEVTCTVSSGPAGVDILWRAAIGERVVGTRGVTLDADGTGTFTFRAPSDAAGATIGVELVDWGVTDDVGVVGGPVPTRVDAGLSSRLLAGADVLLVLAAGLLVLAVTLRRQWFATR